MSMIDVSSEKKTTYEEDLEELTRLVDQIGEEDCPVDQLEDKVRRAADLIRSLRERLSATETTVQEVLSGIEGGAQEDQ
ncbi:MAG: exodeoxyribonuclease VII small subunit [Candidatus Fermentibacteraceae bacterium]|nr:exodeoxyribonuclease VII small subunit [Candidatus Fermentibacteraceae bacterium]